MPKSGPVGQSFPGMTFDLARHAILQEGGNMLLKHIFLISNLYFILFCLFCIEM